MKRFLDNQPKLRSLRVVSRELCYAMLCYAMLCCGSANQRIAEIVDYRKPQTFKATQLG